MKVIRFYVFTVMMIIVTHNLHPLLEEFHRTTPYWTKEMGGPVEEVLRDFLYNLYLSLVVLLGNVLGDTLFLMMASQLCHQVHLLGLTLSSVGRPWDPASQHLIPIQAPVTDQTIIKVCVIEHNRLMR